MDPPIDLVYVWMLYKLELGPTHRHEVYVGSHLYNSVFEIKLYGWNKHAFIWNESTYITLLCITTFSLWISSESNNIQHSHLLVKFGFRGFNYFSHDLRTWNLFQDNQVILIKVSWLSFNFQLREKSLHFIVKVYLYYFNINWWATLKADPQINQNAMSKTL